VRLVQISDAHLFASPDGRLSGMNSQQSLDAVLALIRAQQTRIDLVLCTGDLAQDASEAAYRRLHAAVGELGAAQRSLAGNHDDPAAFARALGEGSEILEKRHALGA